MQSTELTLFCLITFLFLCVGFIIGWLIKDGMSQNKPYNLGPLHPEFFNDDGTINADQIVSLRIDPNFYSEFASDYEDLFNDEDEED